MEDKTVASTVTTNVNVKGQKIGEATHPQYDSIEEAVEALGSDRCLNAINQNVKVAEMAKIRVQKAPKTTEAQIMDIMRAMKRGALDKDTGATKIRELAQSLGA